MPSPTWRFTDTGEVVPAQYVYVLPTGSGEDGDAEQWIAIYATRQSAELARFDYVNERHYRPDGSYWHRDMNPVEEWPLLGGK